MLAVWEAVLFCCLAVGGDSRLVAGASAFQCEDSGGRLERSALRVD